MVRIVTDVQGTRQLTQQLALDVPWLGMLTPCDECVSFHPFVEPSLACMRQRNAVSAANSPQRESAFLLKQYSKSPTKGRTLGISSIVMANSVNSDERLFGLFALSGAMPRYSNVFPSKVRQLSVGTITGTLRKYQAYSP